MSDYTDKLADKLFHNWLKTGLALHITKLGIVTEVTDVIKAFHRKCLNEVRTPEQIAKNELCCQCSKKDVLPCQTRGTCFVKAGVCSLHGSTFIHNSCPKRICDKLRDKIREYHKYYFPSWKNTTSESWCENPWQLAKCYMPPDGYFGADSADETDLNGILNVMINHKEFNGKVEEENCSEAREISKKFRHSADLCFHDDEVNHYLDTLIHFLTCTHHLNGIPEAQEAVHKIQKLKTDSLTITTEDITKILTDVIQENMKTSLDQLNQKQVDTLQGIRDALNKLEEKTGQSVAEILTAKSTAVAEIETSKRAAIEDIQTSTKRLKLDTIREVGKIQEQCIEDIQIAAKSTLAKIEERSSNMITSDKRTSGDALEDVMHCLQEDLVAFYLDEFESIPIAPLVPENDTKLLDFFVQPNLEEVDRNYQGKMMSDGRKEVTCCHEIFMNGTEPCKNIFLSAHAGIGKTTFSKHLCLIWCHCKQKAGETDEPRLVFEDETKIIDGFDLLFFIFLRNEHGRECDIDEMIQSQIISILSRTHLYNAAAMKELLHRKKCLIILDGLDEWSHPKSKQCRQLSAIPHRRARPNTVVIYTTRPWKLHEAKINSSMINKHIEMKILKKVSVEKLTENVIYTLNKITGKEKKLVNFQKLKEPNHLPELISTPVILVQLICLWYDDRPIYGSRCQIYLSILDFLFQHGERKITGLGKESLLDDANGDCTSGPNTVLPSYCKKYYGLILALGKLAFNTIFKQYKELSLVFEKDVVNNYLTDDQLWCCLQMGLLTKNKTRSVSSREYTVSFIHKTFQEFFCALYIQSLSNIEHVTSVILKVCGSVETILEFSNIFVFLAGICSNVLTMLHEKLADVLARDNFLFEFRSDILAWSEWNQYAQTLKEFQNMLVACVKECMKNGQVVSKLWIEDIVFDSDFDSQEYADGLKQLIEMNQKKIKSLSDVRTSGRQPKLGDMVDVSKIESLEKILIIGEMDEDELGNLSGGSLNSLKCFGISSSAWNVNRWIPKYSALPEKVFIQIERMIQLEAMLFECLTLTHDQWERLAKLISMKRNITQVCLEEIKCSTHGDSCQGIQLDLSEHVKHTVFDVGTVPLSDVKLNATSLEKVGMGKLVSPGVQSAILDVLPKAKNLQLFGCFDITSEQDVEKFLNVLSSLTQLQFMVIKRINIGNKSLELSPENKKLDYVQLEDMKLSADALKKLLEKVEDIPNNVTVVLRNCDVTPVADYDELKRFVRTCTRFVVSLDDYTDTEVNMFSFKKWGNTQESTSSVQ